MSRKCFPNYPTARNEIVSVKLNLEGYVTKEEFKNLTKIDTSNFALKTNVAEIKNKVDGIDVNKINIMDEPQEKNFAKSSYLYLNREYEYFEIDKINPHKLLF